MKFVVLYLVSLCLYTQNALAGISLEPYASVSSTKAISPDRKNKTKENETLKERTTYGLRFGIGFFRILKLQISAGQSQLVTTEKSQDVVDDYDQIDFKKDLDMDTNDPDKEVKITEIQKVGKGTLVIDPSFSILILRGRAGIQATQRELTKQETGKDPVKTSTPVTYKPLAGVGAGIKFGPRMYALAEYSLYFYKFPDTKIFEREVSVTYGVSF